MREQEGDKIAALDAGADDYLTKPFGAGELMARIRVALRRTAPIAEDAVFQSDNLTVDMATAVVSVVGQDIILTPTEYDILRALIQRTGKVLTHRQLLRTVWGNAYESESASAARERQQPAAQDRAGPGQAAAYHYRARSRLPAEDSGEQFSEE